MPFEVVKAPGGEPGYFVEDDKGKKFSHKPLTKKVARKQQVAIALSEAKREHELPAKFFK